MSTPQKRFPLFLFLFLGPLFLLQANEVSPECKTESTVVTELIKMCEFNKIGFDTNTSSSLNICRGSAIKVYLGPGCNDQVVMKVFFANLIGFNVEPAQGVSYNLPSSMPDLYVRYYTDLTGIGSEVIGPIEDFEYTGSSILSNSSSDMSHYIYEKEVTLLNFQGGGNPCNGVNVIELDATLFVELVQEDNGDYIIYDLEPFSTPYDVASCEIFKETCGYCDPLEDKGASCDISIPQYQADLCFDCVSECTENDQEGKLRPNQEALVSPSNIIQQVSPNPFQDIVQVDYFLAPEENAFIEIIDTKGSLLKKIPLIGGSHLQSSTIDLSDLPTGLYHARIATPDKTETLRLLKTKIQ